MSAGVSQSPFTIYEALGGHYAGGRRHQGERAFKLLQNGEVQSRLNPVILPEEEAPTDTPNALRHTVNSVTEARCGFRSKRLMPPTPKTYKKYKNMKNKECKSLDVT